MTDEAGEYIGSGIGFAGLCIAVAWVLTTCSGAEGIGDQCSRLCVAQGQRVKKFGWAKSGDCECGDDLPECRKAGTKPESEVGP